MNGSQAIVNALELSRDWIVLLAEDLASDPMATVLPDSGNHAMWVMGHAAHSEGGLYAMITATPNPVETWTPLFQQGSSPDRDAARYPEYRGIVDQFKLLRAKTIDLARRLTDAELDAKPKNIPEAMADVPFFRTVGDVLVFTAMHQMSHFGQLADIRKRLGRQRLM